MVRLMEIEKNDEVTYFLKDDRRAEQGLGGAAACCRRRAAPALVLPMPSSSSAAHRGRLLAGQEATPPPPIRALSPSLIACACVWSRPAEDSRRPIDEQNEEGRWSRAKRVVEESNGPTGRHYVSLWAAVGAPVWAGWVRTG
jgi:hypothetical protein